MYFYLYVKIKLYICSTKIKEIITIKTLKIMTNKYYRNEYTENQWMILVDNAIAVGCTISYNKYATIATIDSTEVETRLCKGNENSRLHWAEHIHNYILGEYVRKEKRF